MMTLRTHRVTAVAGAIALFGAISCHYVARPPLKMRAVGNCQVADLQQLGEYVSPIAEISLREASSGTVVWSARAPETEPASLATLTLCPGENPSMPPIRAAEQTLKTLTPTGSHPFILLRGIEYRLEVVSPHYGRHAVG